MKKVLKIGIQKFLNQIIFINGQHLFLLKEDFPYWEKVEEFLEKISSSDVMNMAKDIQFVQNIAE